MKIVIVLFFVIMILKSFLLHCNKITKKISIIYLLTVGSIMIISMFNPYGLNNVSDNTYFLWLINVFFFDIIIVLWGIKKEDKTKEEINIKVILKSRWFIILQSILLLVLIYYKVRYNSIIEDLPTYQIRIARFSLLFRNGFENLFFNYIILTLVNISSIMFAISVVNKEIKHIAVPLMITNVIVYSTIGFGRELLMQVVLFVIITFLITKNVKEIFTKKNIAALVILIIIAFLVITGMSAVRSKSKDVTFLESFHESVDEQIEQLVIYFTGGFRLLDNYINNGFEGINSKMYGRATLAGLEEIVLYPIKFLGAEISSFNNIIAPITQKSTSIGEQTPYFNAFYTSVMNFHLDFGVPRNNHICYYTWIINSLCNKKLL